MKTTDISNIDISNFLPHRKPMLMVTSVLEIDENSTTTQFYISEDCVFLKDGELSEIGLIENAAQAASGVVGQTFFEKDDIEGTGNKLVGYISAIKKVEIFQLPKVGETIITKAKLLSRFDTGEMTMCSLETETFLDENLIVSSTMNFLIHEV
ncbi:putative 3-hydroxylacyl-(acyl carrier protein) dehydratase [Aequorivita sublithincola DSM 14238]|uniref:Putative 3-hydroxylacyl-(Acyl carrier protein) dehydratase n=1 Tax=Aequorivita sublithincola (strain DSM 14238 / LMG 21431 / ACAM 643 / 9-3) TaxID=746697 RepID=I3YTW5_AEQSU|nr:3-hydroxylacyl-ACP dehydratase [Aequorivita sublithincola]AFL80433.1 putative 3-hydroxylacyl-(acyl carrier protein) dehydratase [Aequorivita sublithincola DSM 14238]